MAKKAKDDANPILQRKLAEERKNKRKGLKDGLGAGFSALINRAKDAEPAQTEPTTPAAGPLSKLKSLGKTDSTPTNKSTLPTALKK